MTKLATISLDDGGRGDKRAVEILRQHGAPATFYLPSCVLLESVYEVYTLDEIRALYEGFEIGCHGRTHRHVTGLQHGQLQVETFDALHDLERFFGARPLCYAYPYGDFDSAAVKALEEQGWVEYARTIMRSGAENVAKLEHPLVAPITCLLGEKSMANLDLAIGSSLPVHAVAHPWQLASGNSWAELEMVLGKLAKAGYDLVTNSEFGRATCASK